MPLLKRQGGLSILRLNAGPNRQNIVVRTNYPDVGARRRPDGILQESIMTETITFSDVYTRRVGGEQFEYRVRYSTGKVVEWSAQVFEDGDLKGQPSGTIADNSFSGEALRQYVIGYIEGIIERGLGIAE
jgi:hypothetical protein